MQEIISLFAAPSEPISWERYGNGHINETYRVVMANGDWYILQKINTAIFKEPALLMENIRLVTAHLAGKCGDPRQVLTLVPTRAGESYAEAYGGCWRMYVFVKDSLCLEAAESPAQFAESAVAFGRFFNQLSDFPAERLTETIPRFHDTPRRLAALKAAVRLDLAGRGESAAREIEGYLSYEAFAHTFTDLQARGELPLRVTHNDTKMNNVLFDARTKKGVCVIDLDTVMPGLIMNDFGDSIRFGASTAAEDEKDLRKVRLDMDLYEAYLRGYTATCGEALTGLEIELLPYGAKMMTYECGVRFLSDYLSGDTYFHIRYPEQNLDRARTQLRLVRDMDAKWDEMRRMARKEIK